MKQILLLGFICLGFAFPGMQEPVLSQPTPPHYIVFEEKTHQGDRVQFLRAQKKAIDVWKQQFPDVPVYAFQYDNNILYRVIPIHSFASIDTLYRQVEQVEQILRNRSPGSDQQVANPSTVSGTVIAWMPELSHHQEAAFSLQTDKPYTEWMFAYLISGREPQAEQALKAFRDYYVSEKLDYPWCTFRVLFGNDTPVMIGIFRAESQAALQAKGTDIWEKHGAELERLWEEVVRHTWKIENKAGWFNPSLSNLPVTVPDKEVAGGF